MQLPPQTPEAQSSFEKTVRRLVVACHARHGAPLRPEDLDEACQETLVAAWRGIDRFEGTGSLESWIYTIARRTILAVFRRRQRVEARETSLSAEHLLAPSEQPGPATAADTGVARVVRGELMRAGGTVFDIVTARDVDGASFESIARRRAMSVTAVKSRYYRSRPELAERLARLWGSRA